MGISSWFGKNASNAGTTAAASANKGSFFSGLKELFTKSADGNVAGVAASASGGAVQGALFGGGAAIGQGVVNLLKQESFILFLAGLLHFFFSRSLGNTLYLYFSIALLIFGTYVFLAFMSEKGSITSKIGGWVVLVFFIFWYFYLGATMSGLVYFGIIFGIILLGITIVTKGRGFQAALAALFPILFFFMDMGLLALFFQDVNWQLAKIFSDLILYMPWWSLLALFCFPSEDKSKLSSFMGILKIVALIYIVVIFAGSLIPSLGHDSLIPSTDVLMNAQKEAEERLSGENPFVSNMACIFSGTTDISGCVQKRQQDAEDNSYCKTVEGMTPGTTPYIQCMEERKKEREKALVQVSGTNDPTIKEPTKVDLSTTQYFPRETVFYVGNEYKVQYPLEVKITNPRQQQFLVEVSCNFTKQSSSNPESFLGVVTGGDVALAGSSDKNKNAFYVGDLIQSKTIYCTYPEGQKMNGTYKLTYLVDLKDLETLSRLSRLFIGDKSGNPIWKKDNIDNNKLLDIYFPTRNYASVGPEDLARLNFAFGHSADYPVIESGRSIILISMIENVGRGEITAIKEYTLNLDNFGVDAASAMGSNSCREGGNLLLPKNQAAKDVYLPSCFITELPSDLSHLEDYVYREFDASVKYDYRIKREENIKVSWAEI